MANAWDDPRHPDRRRTERNALSDFGIERADAWDESDLPPDDNELHVLDLLQRLEKDSNSETAPVRMRMEDAPKQQPTKWAQWGPELTCSACRYLNSADQKFCGFCGSPLQARDLSPVLPNFSAEPRARQTAPNDEAPELKPFVFAEKPAPQPPAFAQADAEAREREIREVSDLEFLRAKTSASLAPSGRWRLPVAVAVLAVASFIGYRIYAGFATRPTPVSSNEDAHPSAVSNAEPDQPARADAPVREPSRLSSAPDASKPVVAGSTARANPPVRLGKESSGAVTPATQRSRELLPVASTNAEESVSAGGREELIRAQRYLSPSTRNSAEAARWLWKSVGKENKQAVLLLSDLYAKGDGVPQSCDQARLLLTVAAKKGNSDASSRLRSFDSAGCQ